MFESCLVLTCHQESLCLCYLRVNISYLQRELVLFLFLESSVLLCYRSTVAQIRQTKLWFWRLFTFSAASVGEDETSDLQPPDAWVFKVTDLINRLQQMTSKLFVAILIDSLHVCSLSISTYQVISSL